MESFPPRSSSFRNGNAYRPPPQRDALPVYQHPNGTMMYNNGAGSTSVLQPQPPPPPMSSGAQRVVFPPYAQQQQQQQQQQQYIMPGRKMQPNFRYSSPTGLFAGDWGVGNYVAVGSYSEDNLNEICALRVQASALAPPKFVRVAHNVRTHFPVTKLCWEPFTSTNLAPKLLSSSDALRLWELREPAVPSNSTLSAGSSNSVGSIGSTSTSSLHSTAGTTDTAPLGTLNEVCTLAKQPKAAGMSAPITSFDWSVLNSATVITASIDTTCTVWDLNAQSVTTQLIAHDKEVFDVAFLMNGTTNQFVSVSSDGSARLFDIRALNNSTIIYESEPAVPLLRVAPCPTNANHVCTFGQDQNSIAVLDLRATRNPLSVLEGHAAPINSIRWIPGPRSLLASGADDCQILVWNMLEGGIVGCYNDSRQVNNVLGSPDGQWLGSISGKSLQAVSVF